MFASLIGVLSRPSQYFQAIKWLVWNFIKGVKSVWRALITDDHEKHLISGTFLWGDKTFSFSSLNFKGSRHKVPVFDETTPILLISIVKPLPRSRTWLVHPSFIRFKRRQLQKRSHTTPSIMFGVMKNDLDMRCLFRKNVSHCWMLAAMTAGIIYWRKR